MEAASISRAWAVSARAAWASDVAAAMAARFLPQKSRSQAKLKPALP